MTDRPVNEHSESSEDNEETRGHSEEAAREHAEAAKEHEEAAREHREAAREHEDAAAREVELSEATSDSLDVTHAQQADAGIEPSDPWPVLEDDDEIQGQAHPG